MLNPNVGGSGLYAITDPQWLPDDKSLLLGVEAALEAGVALVQYRDKTATEATAYRRARALQALCTDYQVPLIINDRLHLAADLGLGVHLGVSDASIAQARRLLGANALLGATCHASLSRAQASLQAGASYVAFGRFFPSQTKAEAPPAELSLLTQARQKLTCPLVAIGGLNVNNLPQVQAAGAHLLALSAGIFAHTDFSPTQIRMQVTALNAALRPAMPSNVPHHL
ncbi:thiamine-phosphate pyrophosphorylase [Allopseudospirillum japonicum]|uniref:Thiamine-phosphate synthase n=1 Tax=Allopseudospirillum japonicum TaxID=64971 RepID=A0A1H6TMZ3_9GAMM|nr:thiamine phosphate synthase [Allopseudospirillum japonicum]SEI81449.1 thiamine-phosphate pyrophosphorylase [Allopseudospirillum japonicum]